MLHFVHSCVVPQLSHFLELSLVVFPFFLTSCVNLVTLPTHSRWLKCCFVIPKSLSMLHVLLFTIFFFTVFLFLHNFNFSFSFTKNWFSDFFDQKHLHFLSFFLFFVAFLFFTFTFDFDFVFAIFSLPFYFYLFFQLFYFYFLLLF